MKRAMKNLIDETPISKIERGIQVGDEALKRYRETILTTTEYRAFPRYIESMREIEEANLDDRADILRQLCCKRETLLNYRSTQYENLANSYEMLESDFTDVITVGSISGKIVWNMASLTDCARVYAAFEANMKYFRKKAEKSRQKTK